MHRFVKFFLNAQVPKMAAQGDIFSQKQLKHMGVYQEHESTLVLILVLQKILVLKWEKISGHHIFSIMWVRKYGISIGKEKFWPLHCFLNFDSALLWLRAADFLSVQQYQKMPISRKNATKKSVWFSYEKEIFNGSIISIFSHFDSCQFIHLFTFVLS